MRRRNRYASMCLPAWQINQCPVVCAHKHLTNVKQICRMLCWQSIDRRACGERDRSGGHCLHGLNSSAYPGPIITFFWLGISCVPTGMLLLEALLCAVMEPR